MKPSSIPNASSSTLAWTARQLVVQDPFELMKSVAGSNWSSFTSKMSVASGSWAGAEITTHLAPASRYAAAFWRLVFLPVDSITTSTPSARHGQRTRLGLGEHRDT